MTFEGYNGKKKKSIQSKFCLQLSDLCGFPNGLILKMGSERFLFYYFKLNLAAGFTTIGIWVSIRLLMSIRYVLTILLILLSGCQQFHSSPCIMLPQQNRLIIDEFYTLRINNFASKVFVLE